MSTSVGTLQPKVHLGLPFVAAVVFALLAATTIGIYVSTRTGTEATTSTPTTITGTAANTPSELRFAEVQASAGSIVRPFGRSAVTPKVASVVTGVNTPSELGTVVSFSTGASILPRAKQLGLDVVAPSVASVTEIAARNAMLASYQQAGLASVSEIAARNAMLDSYQQASTANFIAARNAMLGSYQQGGNDEIIVNGEVCQICWKYR